MTMWLWFLLTYHLVSARSLLHFAFQTAGRHTSQKPTKILFTSNQSFKSILDSTPGCCHSKTDFLDVEVCTWGVQDSPIYANASTDKIFHTQPGRWSDEKKQQKKNCGIVLLRHKIRTASSSPVETGASTSSCTFLNTSFSLSFGQWTLKIKTRLNCLWENTHICSVFSIWKTFTQCFI